MTRNYLDQHKLQERIQSLIQDVLRAQPEDPYRYMLQSLRREQQGLVQDAKISKAPEVTPGEPSSSALAEMECDGSGAQALKAVQGRLAAPEVTPEAPAPPLPGAEAAAEEAAPEAKSAPPLVPRPPSGKRPAGTRPGAAIARPVEAEQPPKAAEEPCPRKQAKQAARASLNMVFANAKITQDVEESCRQQVQFDFSVGLAASIMARGRQTVMDKVASSQDVRIQARANIRNLYMAAAVLISREYQRDLVRWTMSLAMRSAANILGNDQEKQKACFDMGFSTRRTSMPTPIVFLGGETSSWGQWLAPASSK